MLEKIIGARKLMSIFYENLLLKMITFKICGEGTIHMAKMDRDLLSIPATYIPAELLFSAASFTVPNRLNAESAFMLKFLYYLSTEKYHWRSCLLLYNSSTAVLWPLMDKYAFVVQKKMTFLQLKFVLVYTHLFLPLAGTITRFYTDTYHHTKIHTNMFIQFNFLLLSTKLNFILKVWCSSSVWHTIRNQPERL